MDQASVCKAFWDAGLMLSRICYLCYGGNLSYTSTPITPPPDPIKSQPPFDSQTSKQRLREASLRALWNHSLPLPSPEDHSWLYPLPVTAVLMHHRRPRALALQINALSRYPFIKEIIVYNTNEHLNLWKADLEPHLAAHVAAPPLLRIFNAYSFIGDQAIWTACSLASFNTCYYNDDQTFNPQLHLLYAKLVDFHSTSDRIVAAVTSSQLWLYRHFQFKSNVAAEFHGGLAPIHSIFFPRDAAARFLRQLAEAPSLVSKHSVVRSGLFFTAWTNTYPDLFLSDLQIVDIEGELVLASDVIPMRDQKIVVDALVKFYDALSAQDPVLVPSVFPIAPPPAPHDARAPCHNDTCLFTSSQSPFPSPFALSRVMPRLRPATVPPRHWYEMGGKKRPPMRIIHADAASFNPHLLPDLSNLMTEIHNMREGILPLFPSGSDWEHKHSWQLAVDGDDATCWQSRLSLRIGDHFGLDMVPPRPIRSFNLVGDEGFKGLLDMGRRKAWDVLVAYATEHSTWERVQPTLDSTVEILQSGSPLVRLTVVLDSPEPVAKLKIVSGRARTDPPSVCNLHVLN